MSRVGRQPIALPERVKVDIEGTHVTVRGPKGDLSRDVSPEMSLRLEEGQLLVSRPSDAPRHRALHGLTRSLIANMVIGVDVGFSKTLEIYGLGYRVQPRFLPSRRDTAAAGHHVGSGRDQPISHPRQRQGTGGTDRGESPRPSPAGTLQR